MTLPEPNTQDAIDFLVRYSGAEPIVVTAIVPDRAGAESETFRPIDEADRLREWIDKRQGKKNLYFSVNPTLQTISGRVKAKKRHIRGMKALHVDVDPRVGECLEAERKRALEMLATFTPPPSFVIDSGGGFQGFWLLDQEYETQGSMDKAAELEGYNRQIAVQLGGDHCHNIDRIMRLPGTLNIPDAKKLKQGRRLVVARLTQWDGQRYPLTAFTPAPSVNMRRPNCNGLAISGNLPPADIDNLPEKVTTHTRKIIVQGNDPDDPTRFPSRSEALFYVCCDLVRAEVDENVIASILLDPALGISASVLDKPRPNEYAARQIQRAREEIECPELREMNDKHAVIADLGGRCRVITQVADPVMNGRIRICCQTFPDFRNRYLNRPVVEVGKKTVARGSWWLTHPGRRQYETLTFAPGKTVEGAYNLWRGFACQAAPGDCSLFLEHVRENICSGNLDHFEYLMNWLARAIQHPGTPGEVAVVLRGGRGTGKSLFARHFGALFGSHFLHVSDPKHIVGNFNAHLRDTIVLFADEAFFAGDRKHESILKTLITEPTIVIEAKGVDAEVAPNYTHLIMASNSPWVVPAGEDERRFFVLDVSPARAQDSAYFNAIAAQMDSGGREALLHHLMIRDLTGFDVRRVPQTQALRDQKQLSQEPHEAVMLDMLRNGVTPDPDFLKDGANRVSVEGFVEAIGARDELPRRGLQTQVGQYLQRFVERDSTGQPQTTRVKRRCRRSGRCPIPSTDLDPGPGEVIRRTMYQLKPLAELREEHRRLVESWPSDPTEWTYDPDEDGF
jgi:hypothetical protein